MRIYLKIDSWIGYSPGAIHYYGRLRKEDGTGYVDLMHPMSEKSAKRANKQHRWSFPGDKNKNPNKPGQMTNGFDSMVELIDFAIAEYKNIFQGATELVRDTAYVDDQEIYDSKDLVSQPLNQ
jgi:hypothetical protein